MTKLIILPYPMSFSAIHAVQSVVQAYIETLINEPQCEKKIFGMRRN